MKTKLEIKNEILSLVSENILDEIDLESGYHGQYWERKLEEQKDYLFYEIQYAGHSDYSGCMVEKANEKFLKENFDFIEDSPRNGAYYGSEMPGFFVSQLLSQSEETIEEFLELLNGLSNYPVLDEEVLSQMEEEEAFRSFNDNYFSDWIAGIESEIQDRFSENWEGFIYAQSEENFYQLFREMMETVNIYPEIETGGNAYIDIDRINKHLNSLSGKEFLEQIEEILVFETEGIEKSIKEKTDFLIDKKLIFGNGEQIKLIKEMVSENENLKFLEGLF